MMYKKIWFFVFITLCVGYVNNINQTYYLQYENIHIEFVSMITLLMCSYIILKCVFSKSKYIGYYKITEILLSIVTIIILFIPVDLPENKYILASCEMIYIISLNWFVYTLKNEPKMLIKPAIFFGILFIIAYLGGYIPKYF